MKALVILSLGLFCAQGCSGETAQAAAVTTCNQTQLLAYVPSDEEVQAHREFELPVINYPYDTKLDDQWGLMLTVRIDESGRVVCYSLKDDFDKDQSLNTSRRAQIKGLKDWRYAPFVREGRAVPVIVSERINEQESAKVHVPLPVVPLDEVEITLQRSGCHGACPSYKVAIHGDGRVVYEGKGYVDVEGRHSYRVRPEEVARLVESLRTKDIWSLRPAYRADITDNPTYVLTMRMGGQMHRVGDYVGELIGMPSVVTDFEEEVDKVARSDMWVHLSREGVKHLKAEGFNFDSQAGANLLARAVANGDSRDDEAMRELVELGAPVTGAQPLDYGFRFAEGPMIEDALRNGRSSVLIDSLIAKGALKTQGRLDRHKIDAAFRAAIAGGRLATVQTIWNVSGDKYPALNFDDDSDDDKPIHKKVPVTLLISRRYKDEHWEGLEIAKWLAMQGCDLKASKANGDTLLHIATDAGDARFVQFLLAQGLDPSKPGEFGLPALGSAKKEEVALLLLRADMDPTQMDDSEDEFRRYAESNHWARVVAWLDSHENDER